MCDLGILALLRFESLCAKIGIMVTNGTDKGGNSRRMTEEKRVKLTAGIQLGLCALVIGIGMIEDSRASTRRTRRQNKELRNIAFKADKKEAKLKARHQVKQAKKKYTTKKGD
jgi:hypothetical protein